MNNKKINLKKDCSRFGNIFYFFVEKPIIGLSIILLLSLLLGLVIFYRYSFLPPQKELVIEEDFPEFNADSYKILMESWDNYLEREVGDVENFFYPDFAEDESEEDLDENITEENDI